MNKTSREPFKPLSIGHTIECLEYIGKSPPKEVGGFDEKTVEIAKSALFHLQRGRTKSEKMRCYNTRCMHCRGYQCTDVATPIRGCLIRISKPSEKRNLKRVKK